MNWSRGIPSTMRPISICHRGSRQPVLCAGKTNRYCRGKTCPNYKTRSPIGEEEHMELADVTREIKRADLLQMYYYLRVTRALEDRVTALYRQGRIVGGCYTSHGMEAIAVGYASALERDDVIAPFHRDMGAFLIRGITPGEVLAQYLGKRTGPTKGKDGNVHMGDL